MFVCAVWAASGCQKNQTEQPADAGRETDAGAGGESDAGGGNDLGASDVGGSDAGVATLEPLEWTSVDYGESQFLHGVDFPGHGPVGYVSGNVLLKTTNRGASWTLLDTGPTGPRGRMMALGFRDPMVGVVGADNGATWWTRNGGGSFAGPSTPGAERLWGAAVGSSEVAAVVGDAEAFFITNDGGESWTQQTGLGRDFLSVAFAPGGSVGLAVGAGVDVVRTTDSGASWTSVAPLTQRGQDVHLINNALAYVVGDNGMIAMTTDAGDSWTYLESGTTERLRGVDFLNGDVGVAVGGPVLLRTVDGVAWFAEDIGGVTGLAKVGLSGDVVVATSHEGALLRGVPLVRAGCPADLVCPRGQTCDHDKGKCVGTLVLDEGAATLSVTLPSNGDCADDSTRIDTKYFHSADAFDLRTRATTALTVRDGDYGVCCNQLDPDGNQLVSYRTDTDGLFLRGRCVSGQPTRLSAEVRAYDELEGTDKLAHCQLDYAALMQSPPGALAELEPSHPALLRCGALWAPLNDFPRLQYGTMGNPTSQSANDCVGEAFSADRFGQSCTTDAECGSQLDCCPPNGMDSTCIAGTCTGVGCDITRCSATQFTAEWCVGSGNNSACISNDQLCVGNRDNDVGLLGNGECEGPIDYAFRQLDPDLTPGGQPQHTRPFGSPQLTVVRFAELPHCQHQTGVPGPTLSTELDYITFDLRASLGLAPLPGPPAGGATIGDRHRGGKIFYVTEDGQHGLMYSDSSPRLALPFGCDSAAFMGIDDVLGLDGGYPNTKMIIEACPEPNAAARYCDDLVVEGNEDWFLPTPEVFDRAWALRTQDASLWRNFFDYPATGRFWTSEIGAVRPIAIEVTFAQGSDNKLAVPLDPPESAKVRCVSAF